MTKKNPKIGIIAEDNSDIESARVLIFRIANNNKISIKGRAKNGCGILLRKCCDWAKNLYESGCSLLIVIHDSDGNDPDKIKRNIYQRLSPCPITKNLIVIPIQELEAWLLSDPTGIKKALNLKKLPKIKYNTELIDSPKEYLEKAVYKASDSEITYLTKYNKRISEVISIDIVKKKCPSFIPFYNFVIGNTK